MWTQLFDVKNTIYALIFPNLLMNAFNVIMMRTYFTSNIPEAVTEAAKIDGAGEVRILLRIVLPMSVPIVTTLILFIGLGYWNDWLNGLYYISDKKLYSLQVLLNKMLLDTLFMMSGLGSKLQVNLGTNFPTTAIKMAIAVMGLLPILIVYPFFQKYFVKGIVVGAVKG
ncbi:carbohydrate ABC transporter permease [Cohnella rhizosphaerae]|uniref:Carbohydrate ABC transporter permease n=1 Tax=Cohnella rhizosphaerae TaxID=1457232 RepID=A0A9X4QS13_9BACL|nr:carbohydrate ABC transporter permease [Cohnella rhizosphaerae]MDG0808829.1 carbohydrate ABC transporter permease [Cohnella rhizosphaerae]